MPSPLAHFICGAAIASVSTQPNKPLSAKRLALGGLIAASPDLDMLITLMDFRYVDVHRTFSHSIVSLLILFAGLWAVNLYCQRSRWEIQIPYVFISACLLSHIVCDMMGEDIYGPKGLMLLWPLSFEWFPPVIEFFHSTLDVHGNPASLFSLVTVVGIELFVFTVFFLLAIWARRLRAA